MTSRRWEWGTIVVVLVATCVLFLYGLGAAPLQDYDEATYAQVTREMLQSHNWLSLTHTGNPYFEKPPMYMWMAGVSETILGDTEFALRLPSALSGIALVAVVMLLAFELSADIPDERSVWAAVLSGAIVLTMSPVLETARQVRIDVPMALWITLAAYGFVKGLKNPKYFLLFWIAAACALMTKDVIAIFAFAAALAFACWFINFRWLKEKYFWWGAVLFLVLTLPWHIYETLQYGATFWREYIGFDVVERSTQDVFAVQNTNAEYVQFLGQMAAPWAQLFIFLTVWFAIYWYKFSPSIRKGAAACASMVAVVLAVFFIAKTKAPTYLLPLYPFAAVFIGLALAQLPQKKSSAAPRLFFAGVALTLVLIGAASTIYNGFHFNPYFWQADELAREEKIVGELIKPNTSNTFYAFNDTNLGSIMYYSGNTHPWALAANATPGGFVVLPTADIASLQELYPNLQTKVLYSGQQISLEQIE